MIYRILIITLALTAFLIDSQFAPGGSKFELDFLSSTTFVVSLLFTISWILYWDIYFKNKNHSRIFNTVLVFFMTLIYYYEYNTGGRIDPSVFLDNWKGAANPNGLKIAGSLLYDNFVAANVFWALVISSLIYFSYKEKKSKILSFASQYRQFFIFLPFLILILIVTQFHSTYEYYGGIARGLSDRIYSRPHQLEKYLSEIEKEPKTRLILNQKNPSPRPNIILVFVEALSADFVFKKSAQGLEYTPVLNQLVSKGVYFSNHFSVSVQTSRGHFAALCGKIPVYQGLESIDYIDQDFDCLPGYMKTLGYKTYFTKAYGNLDFDNQRNFFLKQGYDEVPQLTQTCDKETEVPCWNWGIQDDEFYRRSIKYIEAQNSPFFLTLTTVTTHMPFVGTPDSEIVHFKNASGRFENYVNTLTVADKSLNVLVSSIENSKIADNTILIVTGDHSFPMGQHNNFHNENYAYNENFHVPLLIYDFRKSGLKTMLVNEVTSHLALPATILDLASFSGETTFMSDSLLKSKEEAIYLVQPYSGTLLGSIRWPWKYLFELRTRKEVIYNLEKDPLEKVKLSTKEVPTSIFLNLQKDVARIIYNNKKVRLRK